MTRVSVLGGGRIGTLLACDLAAEPGFVVTVHDPSPREPSRLEAAGVRLLRADLSESENLAAAIASCDLVAGALPSHLGFAALEAAIRGGKPCCDISFTAEDATILDEAARRAGVTVVFDCGVAPGLSNLMVGHCASALDHIDEVRIYVGGLPFARHRPFEYKAPFAPKDVIAEYTRPVRVVEGGGVTELEALSEPEHIEVPRVGTLEACNTDGLRSLTRTVSANRMREKTLRYPGHFDLMRALRDTGLFDTTPIRVGDSEIRPLDLTAELLTRRWSLDPDEREFTYLRVIVTGTKGGVKTRMRFEMFDETDVGGGNTSMARTTAFPAAIVARMLASGAFSQPGVHAPETLGRIPGMADRVLASLRDRGVVVTMTTETA